MSGSEHLLTLLKPDHVKGVYPLPASSLSGPAQMKDRGTEEVNGELKSWQ